MNLSDRAKARAEQSPAARYDRALCKARDCQQPAGSPRPQPTSAWPAENVQLLEPYHAWLTGSGVSPDVTGMIYIPMAGHVLGLNLKPYAQLDLDTDLGCALDYLKAKQLNAEWLDMNRNALLKFRRFLAQQRGQRDLAFGEPNLSAYTAVLPAWLVEALTRYQHVRQANWRPARLNLAIGQFWGHHTRLWRWLCAHYVLNSVADLKRQHVLAYVDHRLATHHAPSGVNNELRNLHGFLLFLQDQEFSVPRALLRLPGLKQPERLPRFLTDQQVALVRDDLEQRVRQAPGAVQRRDALLDRAAFYLMWQAGLRLGEVEELRLEDLDLPARKLMVREGKGRKDRAVFVTDTTVKVLHAYLAVRGQGPSEHVFLYRVEPVEKDLIRTRIKGAGARVGVKVTPHQLRHTFATQLLNAGCKVTTIQKLLGHRRLDATLVYARVHDHTVSADYYAAMTRIEASLQTGSADAKVERTADALEVARPKLLQLVAGLDMPRLPRATRMHIVEQMRQALGASARQA
jgi:integrase/recombinase XerD